MPLSSDIAQIRITEKSALAEFLPDHGGMLNRLRLDAGSGPVDVIAGIHDTATLMNNRQYRGVHLFPFVNRLNQGMYSFGGKQYQFPVNEIDLDNALHGFLFRENPDQIIRPTENSVHLLFSYDGLHDYFPFPCRVVIEYELQRDALNVQFSVTNTGTTDFPFGIGWHPYFTLNHSIDELALELPRVKRVLINERMLPTGEKENFDDFSSPTQIGDYRFDTCFEIQSSAGENQEPDIYRINLCSGKEKLGLEIWQESGVNGCRFLQICTAPDRNSIAIEPVSCNIDAFNSGDGLRVLKPGELFSSRFGVRLISK